MKELEEKATEREEKRDQEYTQQLRSFQEMQQRMFESLIDTMRRPAPQQPPPHQSQAIFPMHHGPYGPSSSAPYGSSGPTVYDGGSSYLGM
jgi:hypothetical protein